MSTEKWWTEREFLEIWLAAGEGVATETQLSLLNDWVISDAEARKYLYTLAVHQSWLMWNCSPPHGFALRAFAYRRQRLGIGLLFAAGREELSRRRITPNR